MKKNKHLLLWSSLGTLALLDWFSAPAALLVFAAAAAACALAIGMAEGVRLALPSGVLAALALGLLAIGWADARPFLPAPSKELADLYPSPPASLPPRPFFHDLERSTTSDAAECRSPATRGAARGASGEAAAVRS